MTCAGWRMADHGTRMRATHVSDGSIVLAWHPRLSCFRPAFVVFLWTVVAGGNC